MEIEDNKPHLPHDWAKNKSEGTKMYSTYIFIPKGSWGDTYVINHLH